KQQQQNWRFRGVCTLWLFFLSSEKHPTHSDWILLSEAAFVNEDRENVAERNDSLHSVGGVDNKQPIDASGHQAVQHLVQCLGFGASENGTLLLVLQHMSQRIVHKVEGD